MGWAQLRQAARAVVHKTFALDALYFASTAATVGLPVTVRVHSKVLVAGDLQNEGFSRTYEDTEKVVFRQADAVQLNVKKGGILKVEDGRLFRLQVRNAVLDDFAVEYQVTRI